MGYDAQEMGEGVKGGGGGGGGNEDMGWNHDIQCLVWVSVHLWVC